MICTTLCKGNPSITGRNISKLSHTQLVKIQLYRVSRSITLRILSFSWSCLPLAFLKYDWLEKINNCQKTDLSYGITFEVVSAVVSPVCVFVWPIHCCFSLLLNGKDRCLKDDVCSVRSASKEVHQTSHIFMMK